MMPSPMPSPILPELSPTWEMGRTTRLSVIATRPFGLGFLRLMFMPPVVCYIAKIRIQPRPLPTAIRRFVWMINAFTDIAIVPSPIY